MGKQEKSDTEKVHTLTNLCILTYPSMHSIYLIAAVSDTTDMPPTYNAYHVVP